MVPIVEAAARLWTVQEPQATTLCLKQLHEALLQQSGGNKDFNYDASDVFLAIQSASLRFDKKISSSSLDRSSRRNSVSITDQERWSILKQALCCMEALSRMVGPAWGHQALQRRRFLRSRSHRNHHRHPRHRQATPATLPDDSSSNVEDGGSSEEGSGPDRMAFVTTTALVYPAIPEILPPAILRFASNGVERANKLERKIAISTEERMKLVETQLCILQHLCCAQRSSAVEYDQELTEWNIPGTLGCVQLVLAFSLRLVCTGRAAAAREDNTSGRDLLLFLVCDNDLVGGSSSNNNLQGSIITHTNRRILPRVAKEQWDYILLVTRATSDLLSSGWRPLPRGIEGSTIVLSMLVIATRGVELQDLYCSSEVPEPVTSIQSREERLAATSCSAEALSALVSLATRGHIPPSLQRTMVRTVCRLHAQLGATLGEASKLLYSGDDNDGLCNSLRSTCSEEEDQIDHQVAFFASQRELCACDTSDILWAMLANESSVEQSIDVLFSIIGAASLALGNKDSKDSPLFNKLKWNDQTEDFFLADCATVLRVLSSALWGMAPDFAGIPLLRIFWLDAIRVTCQLLSTIHSEFATTLTDAKDAATAKKTKSHSDVARSSYFTKKLQPLVVEAIAALQRATDAELRHGGGIVSAVEWDALVEGVENAIVWLKYQADPVLSGAEPGVVRTDAGSLLLRVAELLDHCVKARSSPLMDYSCQRRLFLCLLQGSASMEEANAEIVDLSVVRAWAMFGFFPFRLEGYRATALELLGEAFKREDNVSAHSNRVRLEALKMLTFQEVFEEVENEETVVQQSLLSNTKRSPDIYLDLLSNCIFPILELILARSEVHCSEKNGMESLSAESEGGAPTLSAEQIDADATKELKLYAIDLTGRLLRNELIDQDQRANCVAMLKRASTIPANVEKAEQSTSAPALAALHQLELCLGGTFNSLPFPDELASSIVDATCQILIAAMDNLMQRANYVMSYEVAASALNFLGQLQLKPRHKSIFRSRPQGIMKTESHTQFQLSQDISKPMVSAALLGTLTEALVEVLRKTLDLTSKENGDIEAKLSSLREDVFPLLNAILIQGVVFAVPNDEKLLFGNDHSVRASTDDEDNAKLEALLCILEQRVALKTGHHVTVEQIANQVSELLARSCEGSNKQSTIRCCRAIFAIAPYIEQVIGADAAIEIQRTLLKRLELESPEEPLLAFFLMATMSDTKRAPGTTADGIAINTFDCCSKIISNTYTNERRSLALHMAIRCIFAAINDMIPEEAEAVNLRFLIFYEEVFSKELKENLKSCVGEELFSPTVVREAIEQRCRSEVIPKGMPSHSRYQALSMECENLESFPVEQEGTCVVSPRVAWLFENVLVVCRVGSKSSRCTGYVEMVLRSAISRKRVLVPIPGAIVLDDPEFPSLLRYSSKAPSPRTTEESIAPAQTHSIRTDSSQVLDQAMSVMERFESMFSPGLDDEPILPSGREDEASTSHASADDEISSATQDGASLISIGESVSTALTASTTSSGPFPSAGSTEKPDRLDESLQDWLFSVFGWSSTDDADLHFQLENHLRTCSSTILMGSYKLHGDNCKRLRWGSRLERAINILDRTAPSNTYKFSLLYLGHEKSMDEDASMEARLLGTTRCCPDFFLFAKLLGDIVPTRHLRYYSAGLDASEYESDGRHTLAWLAPNESDAVVFHVASLMKEGHNCRKRHVGNDNVLIVFVDESSGLRAPIIDHTYASPLVSGHFGFASLFVKQLPSPGLFCVNCRIRSGLATETNSLLSPFAGDNILSLEAAADFVRSLAMKIDTACRTTIDGLPPPTNCLDRARQIHEMKRYVM